MNLHENNGKSQDRKPYRKPIRQIWIEALNIDHNITDPFLLVCGLNFTEDDFKKDVRSNYLKISAVPSRNLPKEDESIEGDSYKSATDGEVIGYRLQIWTGIPNKETLTNISFCVNNLASAVDQMKKKKVCYSIGILLVLVFFF